jgi:hypothetical protein
MAQRDAVDETAPEAPVDPSTTSETVATEVTSTEAPVVEGTEAVSAEGTEASVVEGTDVAEATDQQPEPEKPKVITADEVKKFGEFVTADEGAIKTADKANGALTTEALTAVTEFYAELPNTTVKKAVIAWLAEQMVEALAERMDAITARSFSLIKKALEGVVTHKQTAIKEPVDLKAAFIDAATALYLGPTFLVQPEGLPADWQVQVQALGLKLAESDVPAYLEYLAAKATWDALSDEDKAATVQVEGANDMELVNPQPVAPQVSAIVVRAANLARGNVTRAAKAPKADGTKAPRAAAGGPAYDGPKRSITKHIAEFMATQPAGHFAKISEIRAFKSEEYPEGNASQGAISAALFNADGPKDVSAKLPGIAAVEVEGRKGARKAA